MKHSPRTAWATALLATLLVLAWQAVEVKFLWGGNWSGLFCVGSRTALPAEAAAGVIRVPDSDGYDGQFYRLIAHDPFFQRDWVKYIDDARLRYRRILIPALAWGLAFGQDRFVDAAFIAVIAGSVFLGVFWTGRWFLERGWSPVWGAVFLVVPATLTSIDRMLLDGPLCAVFAGFAWQAGKGKRPWWLLACAPLVKETGVFLAAGSCLAEIRGRRWRSALAVLATQLPALLWFGFVQMHTPPSQAGVILSRPLVGQLERLFTPQPYPGGPAKQLVIQVLEAASIAGVLVSLVLAVKLFWPFAGPVEVTTLLFMLLALGLGGKDHLREAYGYARPVSPFLWAVLVQGVVERRWLAAAPLAVSAAVGITLAAKLAKIFAG